MTDAHTVSLRVYFCTTICVMAGWEFDLKSKDNIFCSPGLFEGSNHGQ